MSLVGASSRRRGEGTKKRRFESSLLYEITSCSSIGDEVGSKDDDGLNDGKKLGCKEGLDDVDGMTVGF